MAPKEELIDTPTEIEFEELLQEQCKIVYGNFFNQEGIVVEETFQDNRECNLTFFITRERVDGTVRYRYWLSLVGDSHFYIAKKWVYDEIVTVVDEKVPKMEGGTPIDDQADWISSCVGMWRYNMTNAWMNGKK